MPDNRKALLRYKILDKCFSDNYHHYYIEDLVDACNNALKDIGLKPVSKRQIQSDIAFMKSSDGWDAPIVSKPNGKRKYIKYSYDFSIMETPISEMELNQLETLITSLSRLQGLPIYDWVEELLMNLRYRLGLRNNDVNFIGFEQNRDLKGLRYLSVIINSIIKKQALRIQYHPFGKDLLLWIIHPYYLKQYNNRWFLIGYNETFNDLTILSLDRIVNIESINCAFIRNKGFDFDTYFKDIIGVSLEKEHHIEHVRLKFSSNRLPYVISKPIHHSQEIENEEDGIITLDVIPNKELISELIWFGEDLEVLSPAFLRETIKNKITGMYQLYSKTSCYKGQ